MAVNDPIQKAMDEFDKVKKMAESGDADAMCHLGSIYHSERNGGLALEWYKKGAAAGSGAAMYQLGNHYLYHDRLEALDWYKKAAAHGFTPANEKIAELECENES